MKIIAVLFSSILVTSVCVAQSETQIDRMEVRLTHEAQEREQAKTDESEPQSTTGWVLRSKHFVFGMPRLVDRRHDFQPLGCMCEVPGISIVVREGLVAANFDRMRAPLWVSQRWTKADFLRMNKLGDFSRPFKEDIEVPKYARAGTSYKGNTTLMDRGHMARHQKNRAWGEDSSDAGCYMTNSTPQHKAVNRGKAWRDLEDELRDIVANEDRGIEMIWVISGSVYRDDENPASEPPESDFADVELIGGTDGKQFGVPDATFKVVGWFDANARFQARGYVFEQSGPGVEMTGLATDPESHIVPIDEIEARTGLDFFPLLKGFIENIVEGAENIDMWGS